MSTIDSKKNKKTLLISILLVSSLIILGFKFFLNTSITNHHTAPQDVMFTLKKVANIKFSEQTQFFTASTIHYFVETKKYHADKVNIYQYSVSSNHHSPPIPINHLFSHSLSYAVDEDNAKLHHLVTIIQHEKNNTVTITAGDTTYDINHQQLISHQPIKIVSPQGTISANSMHMNFINQSLELLNQVHSIFTFPTKQEY